MASKKLDIKKWLFGTMWVLLGAGALVLLLAAMQKKNAAPCSGIEVNISGVSNNFFIDKNDVLQLVQRESGGTPAGKEISLFNLRKLEKELEQEVWVKNAELYFDNNNVLQVSIDEREPVARIFTTSGSSFYVDSSNTILPLSEKFSARLPVFTGFPTDARVLVKQDSALLQDVKQVSMLISADAFLMGMIEQIDITPQRYFEMIPKIGKQVIVFGDAMDATQKFAKLKLFYKSVMTKAGWERYSSINLQFKEQVVARLRAKEDIVADSLRTLQLMQLMADNAARMAADSVLLLKQAPGNAERQYTDTSLIEQSIEREDEGIAPPQADLPSADKTLTSNQPMAVKPAAAKDKPAESATPVVKPTAAAIKPNKPEATSKAPLQKPNPKPLVKQIEKTKPKPKAIMPKN